MKELAVTKELNLLVKKIQISFNASKIQECITSFGTFQILTPESMYETDYRGNWKLSKKQQKAKIAILNFHI